MSELNHGERKHSKLSASGASRWFACPGSVELSEGLPDKSSVWSIEGTKAHEVLETIMRAKMQNPFTIVGKLFLNDRAVTKEMIYHGLEAANFILTLAEETPGSEVLVETRVKLGFIHPQMFGTFDGAVIDYWGTLHVFDYKYGAGHAVGPVDNLQMIFYGIGLANEHGWNFKRVRLWIIQPRIKGYDGPVYWDIPQAKLYSYVAEFKAAVKRVQDKPDTFALGDHCHWCKAKSICPLKEKEKLKHAEKYFGVI